MNNNGKNKGKDGVVPSEELIGSDADKAYDGDGNFNQGSETQEHDTTTPEGSDSETDEQQ